MRQHTRILMIEDSAADAELIERELRRFGFDFSVHRVETEPAMRAVLESSDPDVILADYHLPEFDGIAALKVARSLAPDTPFIFVSGSIGEERAIQALREGATDYILKDRPSRLPVAITRALSERREQQLRRRAQEALQASEERFRYAARATQEVIWDRDLRSDKVTFSEAIAAWGWEIPEEVDRKWFIERVHPDDRDRVLDAVQSALDGTAERWGGEYRFRHGDERYGFVYDRALIVRDRMQRPTRLIGAMLDVTEQRDAEARVRESEIRFRSVAETARDAIVVTDANGTILFWNAAATAMFERPVAEAFSTDVLTLMEPRSRDALLAAMHSGRVTNGDHPDQMATAMRKDGSFFPIAIALSCWEAGGERFCTWIVRDITDHVANERKRAIELAVTRTLAAEIDSADSVKERVLRSIGEDLGFQFGAWWSVDRSAGVLRCARVWTAPGFVAPELVDVVGHMTVRPGEGLSGQAWQSALPVAVDGPPPLRQEEAKAARIRRSIAFPIIETGGVTAVVAMLTTDERLRATNLAAGAETIGRTIGSFLERRRAEEDLRRSQSELAEAQEVAQLGSYSWDVPRNVITWSAQTYRIFGIADGEFEGTVEGFFRFVHPDDRAPVAEAIAPPLMMTEMDFRIVRADGETRLVRCRFRIVDGTPEAPRYLVGTVLDITEQERLERQVEQAHRVSSLGRVAATIAHEFNNVLMGIQPVAEVIRMRSGGDEKIGRGVAQIIDAVARGRRVTQSILRFTQPAEPALQVTVLNEWLQRVEPELQALAGHRAVVTLDLPDEPVTAACDVAQFHQVLSNLVLNAAEAANAGGRITIALRSTGSRNPRAVLTVSDNGKGMPASVLENIFEPLFTTKRTGTGLGLAVVQQIVTRHGGVISVESRVGEGSTFRIELPATSGAAVAPAESVSVPISVQRVLLVEDDAVIAEGLAALFDAAGVECRTVSRGADAVQAIASFGPDAVVLDLGLPDMTGIEVYERISSRWPDLPVVFSTGHGDEAALESHLANSHVAFIRKPYDFETLKSVLRTAAGARESAR